MTLPRPAAIVFICLACLAALPASAVLQPEHVVVLANRNMPESLRLADYYAGVRGIASNRVIALDLPVSEVLSRAFYEDRLRDPFLAELRARKLIEQAKRAEDSLQPHDSAWTTAKSSIRAVVCMYGVPLKIADTRSFIARKAGSLFNAPSDEAAVDSELAMMLHAGYDIRGIQLNPLYNHIQWEDLGNALDRYLAVTRLDGPDEAAVRGMIDGALHAEKYGLHGRAYFDASNSGKTGTYGAGDYWIGDANERFRREGYETVLDQRPEIWGQAFPMESAAVYMGWYTEHIQGPFLRDGFRFAPGAVAYHLHSSSAKTLHSMDQQWCGPLVARGAAASMGAVYEPYLLYTPNLSIFADRLCSGLTLAESSHMALYALSWQLTVLGDPLYRPFAVSLDQQIARLESDKLPEVEWAYLRKVNLLIRDGRFNLALEYLRLKMEKTGSLVLREKLADVYLLNNLHQEGLVELRKIMQDATTAETAIRAAMRTMLLLKFLGQADKVDDVVDEMRTRWGTHPCFNLLQSLE